MQKILDLTKSVYELTEEYPEIIDIMVGLGFSEISKKPMRLSVGKIMTIPKGSKMKNIPMERIVAVFREHGFEIVGEGGVPQADAPVAEVPTDAPAPAGEAPVAEVPLKMAIAEAPIAESLAAPASVAAATAEPENRTKQIKDFLRRLSAGEDLEAVRADFVRDFSEVDASEIMNAEQELLNEGTPLEEVQRLCDVHSALFHGSTAEEMLARAEAAVAGALDGRDTSAGAVPQVSHADLHSMAAQGEQSAAALISVPGHPLRTLTAENDALVALLAEAKAKLAAGEDVGDLLKKVRSIALHYAQKGDLIFPLLKVRYGISGPSEVMWTVDDEVRDEMAALCAEDNHDAVWTERVAAVFQRAEEMVFKEQNILFPLCAQNFTTEEWHGIYRDSKDYATCLGVERETWDEAEAALASAATPASANAGEVVMPGGHVTIEQLTAMLNTIPLEITFVDATDINRFFNEGPKVFKRPGMAIDRDVFSCHPPKIEPMVRGIIDGFKAGTSDTVPIWMNKGGRDMLVTYMAVRDAAGAYLGTMEIVQDMEFAKEHYLGE